MRLAVLSDIHGNLPALVDRVNAEAKARDLPEGAPIPDAVWHEVAATMDWVNGPYPTDWASK